MYCKLNTDIHYLIISNLMALPCVQFFVIVVLVSLAALQYVTSW